jgi:hypothetical protein
MRKRCKRYEVRSTKYLRLIQSYHFEQANIKQKKSCNRKKVNANVLRTSYLVLERNYNLRND